MKSDFIKYTGVSEQEAERIFKDKKHSEKIAEIYDDTMFSVMLGDYKDLINKIREYYKNEIDIDLNIEVFERGISFNDEIVEEIEIVEEQSKEVEEYIDAILEKYPNYDKNIIRAIALKDAKIYEDGKVKLSLAGQKTLKTYCKMVDEPKANRENSSITYNLRKMSILQRMVTGSMWTNQDVKYFKEVAKEAEEKGYATAEVDFFTRAKWSVENMINKMKTKRIEAKKEKGQEAQEGQGQEEQQTQGKQQRQPLPSVELTEEELKQQRLAQTEAAAKVKAESESKDEKTTERQNDEVQIL